MVSILLFDDVQTHNDLLETLLGQLIEEEALDARVALTATNANAIMEYAQAHPEGNIYFLDIEVQAAFTGVDVCKKLHTLDPKAYIVYVSAYPHYAMECVKSHAFDFLLKPFTQAELKDCLLAILRDRGARTLGQPLSIPMGSRTALIDPQGIRYLTTRRNFLVAHTIQGELTWRGSLLALLDTLHPGPFQQISRSCAVNLNHVRDADWMDEKLTMDDGATLPVSRRMRAALRARLKAGG